MSAVFGGHRCHCVGVPAASEFLDSRHIDRSIVQEFFDLGHIDGQESTVSADRVAAQRHGPRFRNVLLEKGQGLVGGFLERNGRCLDLVEQPTLGVHVGDEVVHAGQLVGRGMHDQFGAFGDQIEIVIGEQRRNLNDYMLRRVEASHLKIHPCEHRPQPYPGIAVIQKCR